MEGAAAGLSLQAAAGHVCHRSQGTHRQQWHPSRPREHPDSSPALWRPWMLTARDGEMTENQQMSELDGQLINFRSKGALGFQHPVRLYLPKSKSQKFLNNIGEKVLASFPVQATIHFYNDDADSEEDEEEISSA
ncbi:PREDICTED: protein ripply3 [Chlamydotis macqueenii]|uniref:protein ripply3 n=1 Tax=Chlamydotis macqueenii TaxID=187382 RepID=UPI000529E7FF|nr:PREDICTED: protein ripply3 [Chlamydotis macqueenii]